jgi:hypothetical protein
MDKLTTKARTVKLTPPKAGMKDVKSKSFPILGL